MGKTLSEHLSEITQLDTNARSVLSALGGTEHIEGKRSVWTLPDGSMATIGSDGTVAFWGKP